MSLMLLIVNSGDLSAQYLGTQGSRLLIYKFLFLKPFLSNESISLDLFLAVYFYLYFE